MESPPLRVRLARHPDGDLVMMNVKHAAIDGFGSLRILRSIARAYWGLPDPQPDLDLDVTRDLHHSLAADDAAEKSRRIMTLLDKLRDEVHTTADLAVDGGTEKPGFAFHHVSLSPETTKALAAVEGGTVNDVLLAASAPGPRRLERGARRAQQAGRRDDAGQPPAQGVVGGDGRELLAQRQGGDDAGRAESPESLLEAIAEKSTRIKEGGTGAALIEALGGLPAVPVWAKHTVAPLVWFSGDRLVDTALLSNLGKIDEPPAFGPDAGDTTEMWFTAPCRMPLGLSIGTVTTAGRMHIAYRYRHPQFDAEAAARFADRYAAALDLFAPG